MKDTLKSFVKVGAMGILLQSGSTLANDAECERNNAEKNYQSCDTQLGWYIGGQLGYAQTDISQSDIDTFYNETGFLSSSINIEDSDLAMSLMLGYQFNTYWALEGSYIDLGERKVDFIGSVVDLDTFYDNVEHIYPQSSDGFSLAIVGSLPLSEDFKLSAKLGYLRWEGDYTTYDISNNVGSDRIKGKDFWFGVELNYLLSERTQIYFTGQRFTLDRDDNNVLALGIRYYFGEEKNNDYLAKEIERTPKKAAIVMLPPQDKDKDGIVDAQDACADSNILHQVDSQGCTIIQEQIFNFNLTIYYANNSSEISSSYDEKLQDLAGMINENSVKQLNVYGHTSAPGSRQYNMKLSQKRAQSVSDVLQEKFNISGNIINPTGRGEEVLADESNTEAAHQVNRRIELNIEEKLFLPVSK